MRSHFRGSLRHPSQAVTSPHREPSFSTLPAPGFHAQSSFTNTDGNASVRSYVTTSVDEVPYKSLPVGATPTGSKLLPPQSVPSPLSSEIVICILCDKIADTKLIPCNHIVLCEEHAKLSKKCPECRVSCYLRKFPVLKIRVRSWWWGEGSFIQNGIYYHWLPHWKCTVNLSCQIGLCSVIY